MFNKAVSPKIILFIGLLFFGLGIFFSLFVGTQFFYDPEIFKILRLPRTLSAIAVGGGLSVAGALVQASFGNPLADPYTLGIASAAALGAVVGSFFHTKFHLGPSIFAFIFSLLALIILSLWLRRRFFNAIEVLLTGIIAGFFCSSLAAFLLAISDPSNWISTTVWLMGTLNQTTLVESSFALVVITFSCAISWLYWKPLDLLAIDELAAKTVGVNAIQLRKQLFIIVALIVAICASTSGIIGFIGLIIPHALRKSGLQSHLALIPASFFFGGALLLFSDVCARLIIRPSEVPVGIILSLLGAPAFLWIARSERLK